MNRLINWTRREAYKNVVFKAKNMRPKNLAQVTQWDLHNMHDLRRYYKEKMPFTLNQTLYHAEFVRLHDELIARTKIRSFMIAIGVVVTMMVVIRTFEWETDENVNWNGRYRLIHDMKLLMGKDEGGVEGEE